MNNSENMFFRILDIFAHFVLINTLWIIFCLPIITIFPSTTALFQVTRTWHKEGMEAGAIHLFFKAFKENFFKSFIIGIIWAIAGIVLYVDFSILFKFEFSGKSFIFTLFIFSLIIFIFTTIYIFFVMSNYQLTIIQIIKHSLLLSVSNLIHTLLCLVIILGAFFLVVNIPILFIIFGSTISFVLTYIFLKLETKVKKITR